MKKDIKVPQYDPIPRWYELFLKDEQTVGIRIHRTALNEVSLKDQEEDGRIRSLLSQFGLKLFTQPGERSWGFENAFVLNSSEDSNWVVWTFKLPNLKSEAKKWIRYEMALRCSLEIFAERFTYVYVDAETGFDKNQLIIIDGVCLPNEERMMGNGSLSAYMTPDTIKWISSQPEGHLDAVNDAMRSAYEFMWKGSTKHERFGACCRGKFLVLNIPGNACDMAPDSVDDREPDIGYRMWPHNTDSGLQQLTFIVGLAKLHDLMKNDGF